MKLMNRYVNGNTQKIASVNTAGEVNELNQFFNRFDCHDFSQKHRQIHDILNRSSAEEDDFQRLNTNEDEVRRAFQHVNPNKATGPDSIAPRVLKACAEQLAYPSLISLMVSVDIKHHVYFFSLLTFFALHLMRVSPQILFQLLGKLHALCLYRNDLSYCP